MKKQKHIRTIIQDEGRELIERLTFYHSIIPESEEKLWEIIEREFPLISKGDIKLVKQASGALDVVPSKPQPRPEDFLEYKEFSIYHCNRPKNVEELIEGIRKAFPNIPLERVVPMFGIVSISFSVKK